MNYKELLEQIATSIERYEEDNQCYCAVEVKISLNNKKKCKKRRKWNGKRWKKVK